MESIFKRPSRIVLSHIPAQKMKTKMYMALFFCKWKHLCIFWVKNIYIYIFLNIFFINSWFWIWINTQKCILSLVVFIYLPWSSEKCDRNMLKRFFFQSGNLNKDGSFSVKHIYTNSTFKAGRTKSKNL